MGICAGGKRDENNAFLNTGENEFKLYLEYCNVNSFVIVRIENWTSTVFIGLGVISWAKNELKIEKNEVNI